MKKNTLIIILTLCLSLNCLLLSACSNSNYFGIVFTAVDPNTNFTGLYRYSSGTNSIEQIGSNANFEYLVFKVVYVSDDGKSIFAKHFSDATISLERGDRQIALFLFEDGRPIQEYLSVPYGIESVDFSSDGKYLAFEDGNQFLWVGNTYNQNIADYSLGFAPDNSYGLLPELDWSPDNKFIAYVQQIDPLSISDYVKSALYTEVYLLDISTMQSSKLTDFTLGCHDPSWASTGEWIALQCISENNSLPKILLVTPDGQRKVTIECPKPEGSSSFVTTFKLSPDGKKMAYVCNVNTNAYLYYSELEQINQKMIPITIIENIVSIDDLAWTPDSEQLVFAATSQPDQVLGPEKDVDQLVLTTLDGSYSKIISTEYENYQDLFVY